MVGRNDLQSARHHTDLATRGLVGVMVGLFGALILMSPALVRTFYPGGYEEATDLLPVLLVGVLVTTIAAVATTHLLVARAHGQRLFAAINVLGFVLGVAVMIALLLVHDSTRSVALGYVVGATVVGLAPIVVTWRFEGHRWADTALRALAGAALIWLGYVVEQRVGGATLDQFAVVAVFLLLWVVVARRELGAARRELWGRASTSATARSGRGAPSSEVRRT
jgi:O-antigen/teichoic acid export membrane protein